MKWGVVIAAGGVESGELAQSMGTPRKALADFGGQTSLQRTLAAVQAAGFTDVITVSGPEVAGECGFGKFAPEGATASDNLAIGVRALRDCDAFLTLPADSPLLTAESLTAFVASIGTPVRREWFAVGMSPIEAFRAEFPDCPVTGIKFREGEFVTGALYACSRSGFEQIHPMIEGARGNRKNQLKLAARLGLGTLLRFKMGRLTIPIAQGAMERLLQGQVILDTTAAPCTCMDFDDVAEFRAVQSALARHGH